MFYSVYEMNCLVMMFWWVVVNVICWMMCVFWNLMGDMVVGCIMVVVVELFEFVMWCYGKLEWMIDVMFINGYIVVIEEEVVWLDFWCDLLYFCCDFQVLVEVCGKCEDCKVLFVVFMFGYYVILLCGMVEIFLFDCEVYIIDWQDVCMVLVSEGCFDFDDFVVYICKMIVFLGLEVYVVVVCQLGLLILFVIVLMVEDKDLSCFVFMIFMGLLIDMCKLLIVLNILVEEKLFDWFVQNLIYMVFVFNFGVLCCVYLGFLQLVGFMNMNLDCYVDVYWNFFNYLVEGDGDSVEKYWVFYDEYLVVMDLLEEFYLQIISDVFQEYKLVCGIQEYYGCCVDVSVIEDIVLFIVEGECDDILGIGQIQVVYDLCFNLLDELQLDWVQLEVGYYGVFNGCCFCEQIVLCMCDFWDEKGGVVFKCC